MTRRLSRGAAATPRGQARTATRRHRRPQAPVVLSPATSLGGICPPAICTPMLIRDLLRRSRQSLRPTNRSTGTGSQREPDAIASDAPPAAETNAHAGLGSLVPKSPAVCISTAAQCCLGNPPCPPHRLHLAMRPPSAAATAPNPQRSQIGGRIDEGGHDDSASTPLDRGSANRRRGGADDEPDHHCTRRGGPRSPQPWSHPYRGGVRRHALRNEGLGDKRIGRRGRYAAPNRRPAAGGRAGPARRGPPGGPRVGIAADISGARSACRRGSGAAGILA
jgi:hypothetical protein